MRLSEYLSDKKYLIVLFLVVTLITGSIIYMGETVNLLTSSGLYAVEISVFLFIIYLTIEFLIKKMHYNALIKVSLSQELDWVNSMPLPRNAEQRIYQDLMQKLYRDANGKLAEYHSKSSEDLEFLTMWVHEIKTPIAASKLIIENSLNEPSENVLYSIEDEIGKIEDLVQMTLYYSRANDFAKDYAINSVSLDRVVRGCVKREYSNIKNKNLNLDIDNLSLSINSDEKWLGFIIKQVLDNAINYSQPGGKIKIYVDQNENEKILNIEDFGVGIKDKDIRRIFDKNFTGDNGRKFYSSTGIGLYLSQILARKLGHFISVTSNYGNGTKVSVHFAFWNDYFDI